MAADLKNLNARAQAVQAEFARLFPEFSTTSGHRGHNHNQNVGGAKSSQHLTGNAFDYVPNGTVSDARKLEALNYLRSQGANGFGTYRDGSFHADFRTNPAAWGPNKRSSSLGQTPEYFQSFARSLTSGGQAPQAPVQVAAAGGAPVGAPVPAARPAGFTMTPQAFLGSDDLSRFPAGMRNNNPGNIKYVGQRNAIGPSRNTDQGDPQAVYASPQDGAAAMGRLLVKRFDEGRNTPNSLIAAKGGWTPGNTGAAANIARSMGIDPNTPINLRDSAQLQSFMKALTTQEHGAAGSRYHPILADAASSVLGGGAPAAPAAPVVSGTGIPNTPVTPGLLSFDRVQPVTPYSAQNFRAGPNDQARLTPLSTQGAPPVRIDPTSTGGIEPRMEDFVTPPGPSAVLPPQGPAPVEAPAVQAPAPVEAPAVQASVESPVIHTTGDSGFPSIGSGLLGFDPSGFVGTDTSGQTLDANGGMTGVTPAPASVAPTPPVTFGNPALASNPTGTDPATTGGPQAAPATTGAAAQSGGMNPKTTQALQQGLKGLVGLGALGARGPLHYAPPSNGGSPVNKPDVATPDIYKNQGFILPKIVVRGLLG